MPALRADRPAIVVSSTSWTPDEDFSILLEALTQYELRAREVNRVFQQEESEAQAHGEPPSTQGRLPKLLMIVTGKGPLQAKYMKEIEALQRGEGRAGGKPWEWVQCASMWLEAADYPLLLGQYGHCSSYLRRLDRIGGIALGIPIFLETMPMAARSVFSPVFQL